MGVDKIVPSTKIYSVSVHKLKDTACSRYYFWRWVYNIIPKGFKINLWFGSVVHTGIESVGGKKTLKQTKRGMEKISKKIQKEDPPNAADLQEVRIQTSIADLMIEVYKKMVAEKMKGYELGGTEVEFRKSLSLSPLTFLGRLDAWYQRKNRIALFEGKTARQPSVDYFKRLKFDKQINGYAIALKDITGKYPRECHYTVFRKPQIRQRKSETREEFAARLTDDLINRKDETTGASYYFIFWVHKFGLHAIEAVLKDIECMAFDLYAKYEYLSTNELLDLCNWPRNEDQCFKYGTCPYFILCKNPVKWHLYLRFFKMREIRYDEEYEELQKPRGSIKRRPK